MGLALQLGLRLWSAYSDFIDRLPAARTIIRGRGNVVPLVAVALVLCLPQLLFALAGGLVARRIFGGLGTEPGHNTQAAEG
jgi:hypothetical protein